MRLQCQCILILNIPTGCTKSFSQASSRYHWALKNGKTQKYVGNFLNFRRWSFILLKILKLRSFTCWRFSNFRLFSGDLGLRKTFWASCIFKLPYIHLLRQSTINNSDCFLLKTQLLTLKPCLQKVCLLILRLDYRVLIIQINERWNFISARWNFIRCALSGKKPVLK